MQIRCVHIRCVNCEHQPASQPSQTFKMEWSRYGGTTMKMSLKLDSISQWFWNGFKHGILTDFNEKTDANPMTNVYTSKLHGATFAPSHYQLARAICNVQFAKPPCTKHDVLARCKSDDNCAHLRVARCNICTATRPTRTRKLQCAICKFRRAPSMVFLQSVWE